MKDWFSKHLTAWVNLRLLGRGKRFRFTEQVLAALETDLHQRAVDHIVFSGDATALGFEEEMARAAHLLPVRHLSGLAVPGNHDYCTDRARRSGHFERHFAPWQAGQRIDDAIYPFAQRVGPLWLIGVNSATANRWPIDARGRVGSDQLQRLERLLAQLDDGPRILVTHYPICVPSGQPEHRLRHLRDLHDLVAVAQRGGINLWLHGHRHDFYHHAPSDVAPFPVICAGSATQSGSWSYSEYTISGWRLQVRHRVYDAPGKRFQDGTAFELELSDMRPALVK
jgi:3',5'-cyclic AMP phosphodiesterase CpdA